MNMTTFSNMKDLGNLLETTDEKCDIHDIHKVKVKGLDRQPTCTECARITQKETEKRLIQNSLDDINKKNTYDWLDKRSIMLDQSLKKASFESFETNDKETAQNKKKALDIARKYYTGEVFNSVFTGKAGTGKSHLAMSMLKVVNEHSDPYRKCLFVSIDELMRRIKDSFSHRDSYYTEQRMVELLVEADLLVIDDLGAETGAIGSGNGATDFTTRTLYAILNGRINKPTIFTSNLNSKGIKSMYDSKLVSRMFKGANGHVVEFKNTGDKRLNLEF